MNCKKRGILLKSMQCDKVIDTESSYFEMALIVACVG